MVTFVMFQWYELLQYKEIPAIYWMYPVVDMLTIFLELRPEVKVNVTVIRE